MFDGWVCDDEIVEYRGAGYIYYALIGVVHNSSVVLLVTLLLSGCLCGVSLINVFINVNPIVMMIMVVVISIIAFVRYYIAGDVSMMSFQFLIVVFLGFMVLILSSSRMLIFLRWEGIGVMSICLIRY